MRDTRPQHDPARQGHRCFTGDPTVARVAAGSALELHGVVREWRVGAGRCLARVRALRGVSLTVRAGEIVAVTGGAGAGKTTLLLCAAGIVRADAGLVRQPALGCAAYIGPHDPEWARHALAAVDHGVGALLLDVLDGPACASPRAVATVANSAARAGLAVVVAAREASALPAFASRLLELRDGRLVASTQPLAGRWPGARAVAASLPLAPCRP